MREAHDQLSAGNLYPVFCRSVLQSIVGYDRRSRGTRAAGQRLVLDAPFIGAHTDRSVARDLDEIDVRTLREPPRIVTDTPAASVYVDAVDIMHHFHVVGNPRIEEPPAVAAADFRYIYHAQLDFARGALRTPDVCRMHAVRRVEIFGFPADAQMFGEEREAAGAVAAHLPCRPVGVVVTHRAVQPGAAAQGHQPVGADAEMTVAQGGDMSGIRPECSLAVVDQDEIVARPLVFDEFYQHFR